MVQIEIPTEFEPHMVEKIRSGALVLFSLLSFWLMSSANTSHHAQPRNWKECQSIYKYLSHHYILRRSVVFIVDSQYDSVFFRDKAMTYTKDFFENELDGEDYFGFIPLSSKSLKDEIILEKRSANEHIKKRTMKDFSEREMDFVVHAAGEGQKNKTIRLERAL